MLSAIRLCSSTDERPKVNSSSILRRTAAYPAPVVRWPALRSAYPKDALREVRTVASTAAIASPHRNSEFAEAPPISFTTAAIITVVRIVANTPIQQWRLLKRRWGVRPLRAGGAALAASTQRPPVEAGGGSGGAKKWLCISYPLLLPDLRRTPAW
jgi:hypothetical protein